MTYLASIDPAVAWLVFVLGLCASVMLASLAWDGIRAAWRWARRPRRRRPSWARWRRLKAAHRAARYRAACWRLYLNTNWGI